MISPDQSSSQLKLPKHGLELETRRQQEKKQGK